VNQFPFIIFGNVHNEIIKQSETIIQLSLPTCLQCHKCFQESIWKIEKSAFPQFWYGESISINNFWQCSMWYCQTKWNHHATITASLFEIS